MPPWILSAISDGDKENPQTSVGRLIALAIVVLCVLAPAVLWFWLSCWSGKLQEVPASFLGFMTASGALATGLYAITKNKE